MSLGLKACPIFAIGLGSDEPPHDLELSDLQVSDVAFVDDMLTFRFNVTATGYANKQVEVRLKDKKSGAVLSRQTVVVAGGQKPQLLTLAHRPTKSDNSITLSKSIGCQTKCATTTTVSNGR